MPTLRESADGRRHRATDEFDGDPVTQVGGPERAGVDDVRADAPATFWPTRVYPRIAPQSQRVSVGRWVVFLVALDALVAAAVVGVATLIHSGSSPADANNGIPYVALAAVFPVLWIAAMLVSGSYDRRYLAAGPEATGSACRGYPGNVSVPEAEFHPWSPPGTWRASPLPTQAAQEREPCARSRLNFGDRFCWLPRLAAHRGIP